MNSGKISIDYPIPNTHFKSSIDLNTQHEINTLVYSKHNEIETQRELAVIQPKSTPEFINSKTYTFVLKLLKFSKCGILLNAFIDPATLSLIGIIFIICGLKGLKNLKLCYLYLYIFWQIITSVGYIYVRELLQSDEFNIFFGFILIFKMYTIVLILILIIIIRNMSVHNKLFILKCISKNPIVVCIYC